MHMYGICYEDCDIVHNNYFKLNSIIRKKISLSDVVQRQNLMWLHWILLYMLNKFYMVKQLVLALLQN